jgi:glutamate synthase (NADPH/NADH) small chain
MKKVEVDNGMPYTAVDNPPGVSPDPGAPIAQPDSGYGPMAKAGSMKPFLTATWKDKYIWCDVPRMEPPKRSAMERVADSKEIYSLFDEATVMQQASRCVQCALPFCMMGCPLGNRIPEWLGLIAEGKFIEAAAISRSTSNMPEICSRICPQERLCESMCTLLEKSDPIPIGAIEKFVNEYAFAHQTVAIHRMMPNGMKVAIIGSGPAGMAVADELALRGYAVTVFEALPVAGGLLVNGIPSFKLDKAIVDRRLSVLERRGVVFKLNTQVGKDVEFDDLLRDFDAVFLGIGALQSKALDIRGADLKGVYQALPFLMEKNLGPISNLPSIPILDKHVVVLGGGDTAMDCLRASIRGQARQAICAYRRDLANMPGSRKEYKNALEEGAIFQFLTNPVELIGDAEGRVVEVKCVRMELGEPDAKGRRKPYPIPGSEFSLPADVVLVAYGFDPVPFPPGSGLSRIEVNDWGGVMVDENQMTNIPGVFAGGDLVRGANLVVYAVRDGRKAAQAIHNYLTIKHSS